MIYEVTYHDADGIALKQVTFGADSLREFIGLMLSIPSLAPPEDAADLSVRVIPA